MSYDWEGNRRSGVALVRRRVTDLSGLSTLVREMSTIPTPRLLTGRDTLYLLKILCPRTTIPDMKLSDMQLNKLHS